MNRRLVSLPLSAVLSVWLSACGGTDQARTVFVPNVDLQCTEDQVDDCSALGHARTFRVGLVAASFGVDCASLINSAGSDFAVAFSYSGTATSEFLDDVLRGSVLQWADENGDTTAEIESGFYTVCAHLDTDQNDLLSDGEPVATKVINVSLPDQLVDEWTPFTL